jgi:hypothetical protein
MTSHSEHYTWTGNWDYLKRCFPSLERAPKPVHDGFHERFSKLTQNLVREAITRARQSRQGNALTVEQLGTIYGALVPRYDTTQPSMAARIISHWCMYPRNAGAAYGPYRTLEDARKAQRDLPGTVIKAQWVKPGDGAWFEEIDEGRPLSREAFHEVLVMISAVDAQWQHPKDRTVYSRFIEEATRRLEALPSPHPSPQGATAAGASGATSGVAATRSLSYPPEGGFVNPPQGINRHGLARHGLPPGLMEQFNKAVEADESRLGALPPLEEIEQ